MPHNDKRSKSRTVRFSNDLETKFSRFGNTAHVSVVRHSFDVEFPGKGAFKTQTPKFGRELFICFSWRVGLTGLACTS